VLKKHSVKKIQKENGTWIVETEKGVFSSDKLVIATGSNTKIWNLIKALEHTIIPPVPSLFTFNIQDSRIKDLPGIAMQASVKVISDTIKLESEGALLITHWGLSGPAILKLSAWGARDLEKVNYQFKVKVNWLLDISTEKAFENLIEIKETFSKQLLYSYSQLGVTKRLWQNLLAASEIEETQKWAETTNKQLQKLAHQLTQSIFQVTGKSTFKEEFVTAGGVDLKEVNFKTYESKLHKNLYFAGEVLNIDAITGGFNFQNAWTGGFIVAKSIAE
jgi:predicted Rossmann fold flavoprotein